MTQTKHPIIQAYTNSNESLDKIVTKLHDENQYLESVWAQLVKAIHLETMDQDLLIAIDKAILKGHPDSNVYMLFIAIAIAYNNKFKHLETSHSLCSIAASLAKENISPAIKALFLQHRANLFRIEGEINKSMELMNEALTLVKTKDPRYIVILYNTFFMVAIQGKLKVNGKYDIDDLKWDSPDDQYLYSRELKIENAIVTGDFIEGQKLIDEYIAHKPGLPLRFNSYNNMFQLISGDFNEQNYNDEKFKYIAELLNQLATGKSEEAKTSFNNYLQNNPKFNLTKLLLHYTPIHIELNLGNKGKANYYLEENKKNGATNFFDNLFYGRLRLLEKDYEGANQSFLQLLENVNRYGATNRLLFELQFVKEMNLSNILRLMNGWQTDTNTTTKQQQINRINQKISIAKGIDLLIGKSHEINQIKSLIKKFAQVKEPILITGETGTGKELVARAIHDEGLHPEEPFLAINCGALTDSLLQSELFGFEAGTFTGAQKQRKGIFEAAGKGTIFLDEFGEISTKLQVTLLRVLESNEIRLIGSAKNQKIKCKIIIATNINLNEAVANKKFRQDLFFRLSRFEIHLPALKDRKNDIPELVQYFLNRNSKEGKTKRVSPELSQALATYNWPGNIRELKNEIEKLSILYPDSETLELEHFNIKHSQEPAATKANLDNKNALEKLKNIEDPVIDFIQKGFPVETRLNQIKDLFLKYKKLTRRQIMEITKTSTTTATKDLLVLTEAGFIVRRTPTKSSRTDYFEVVSA